MPALPGAAISRSHLGFCLTAQANASGHVYLDLKDDRAVLSSVIWKGQAAKLAMQPEEGMEVIATGKLTTFPGQSRYQMVIEDIRPAGVGALMAMLEKRKALLQSEGLFAPERKRPLPYLPEVIGVVTSPQGAVIRDILHRLRDRFPRKVLIWPVAVQGEACAPQVTAAIEGFNALTPGGALPRPDLLIVARGGGSIEDLWGFNEENVARAAAASHIPLISAVGHETDTTLIDYVSDRRAPTPTAAAEMAVPVRMDLIHTVDSYDTRMARALSTQVQRRRERLRDLARALPRPDDLTAQAKQRLDIAASGLATALTSATQAKAVQLERAAAPLRPTLLATKIDTAKTRTARSADLLARALVTRTERDRARLTQTSQGLRPARLTRDLQLAHEKLDRATTALANAGARQITKWQDTLARLDRMRETLGYKETLARGYAVVWGAEGVITTAKAAKSTPPQRIEFQDTDYALTGTKPKPAKPAAQSSLFDD